MFLAAWGIQKGSVEPAVALSRSQLDAEIEHIETALSLAQTLVRKTFLPCGNQASELVAELKERKAEVQALQTRGAPADVLAAAMRELERCRKEAGLMAEQIEARGIHIESLTSDIKTLKQRLADLQSEWDSLAR